VICTCAETIDDPASYSFLHALGLRYSYRNRRPPSPDRNLKEATPRLRRQFDQLVEHTQRLMRESPLRRAEYWSKADATNPDTWKETSKPYRDRFWEDVIGKLPPGDAPMNPRTRLVCDTPKFRGYEVVLDLYSDRPQTSTINPQLSTQ